MVDLFDLRVAADLTCKLTSEKPPPESKGMYTDMRVYRHQAEACERDNM